MQWWVNPQGNVVSSSQYVDYAGNGWQGPFTTKAAAEAAAGKANGSTGNANGRPWFIRYNAAGTGLVGGVGSLDVPFQPSNEAEQLFLEANPEDYVWFSTKAEAESWLASNPAGRLSQRISNDYNNAGNLTGLNAIGNFFNKAGQSQLWIRVVEVGLGLLLIAVGVAKLTHAVPIATKIAGTAAKAAVL
jgi:hypothetical protein